MGQPVRSGNPAHPRFLPEPPVVDAPGRQRSRPGISHRDLRSARARQFRQAARSRPLPGFQGLGRRSPGGDGRRGLETPGAGRLVLRRPRDFRLCHHPWRGQARWHQLRRCQHQGRSSSRRRQSQEPAFDGIGGPRHQHRGDARLRARLLLQAADPRRLRGHALIQHDGAAQGPRRPWRPSAGCDRRDVQAQVAGVGDSRRGGSKLQDRQRQVHRLGDPRRKAFDL